MSDPSSARSDNAAGHVRKLAMLVDVARNLSACRTIDAVIESILVSAMAAIETADAGIFYLYDEQHGLLKVQTAIGLTDHVYILQMKPGESMSGRAFATGQAAHYNDYNEITQVMGGQSRSNLAAMSKATAGVTFPKAALVAPLKLTGQPIGVLVLDSFSNEEAFVPSDLSLLQSLADQAAIAIDNVRQYERQANLLQQLELALHETEMRSKQDLIDELLSDSAKAVENSARALGLETTTPTISIWIGLDSFTSYLHTLYGQQINEALIQQAKQQLQQSLAYITQTHQLSSRSYTKGDEFVVFLHPATIYDEGTLHKQAMDIVHTFREEVQKRFDGLTISAGIGLPVIGIESIIASLKDARRMVNLHQRNRRFGRIFFLHDLGIDRLLLQFEDAQMLSQFAQTILSDLIKHDRVSGNHDLLNTLAAYFSNNRNIADTARATHLHPNTVRYRMDRVRELLPHEDWLSIELAVRIYLLQGAL